MKISVSDNPYSAIGDYVSRGGIVITQKGLFLYITLLLFGISLSGCNSSLDKAYSGILLVNEQEYFWQGTIIDNEYTIGKKVGEVKQRVKKEVIPEENLSSNFLEVGEEIYTSNEDPRVMIVKRKNGDLEKMTVEDYYKNE
ncbi:hypothetical protein A6P54_17645 [Bacillus sp. MKU004]|nr:hypothetical protein A6P54_17645 [Bacillus sp. MKU004]